MRMIPALGLLAALSACSTTSGGASNTYATTLDALRTRCESRDGVLQPSRRLTGLAEQDYVCFRRNGPSDNIIGPG